MPQVHFTQKTQVELAVVARQVADMPHDDRFTHSDLAGAALDLVPGFAQMEVEEVVRRFGYAVTLAYAEHLLRDLLP